MLKKWAFAVMSLALLLLQQSCVDFKESQLKPYVRNLEIVKLSEENYLHVSYLKDGRGGYIPCNGFMRKEGNEVFIFDTPIDDQNSAQLLNYIEQDLNATVKAVMVSHFHKDAAGGLAEFMNSDISIYASEKTAQALQLDTVVEQIHSFTTRDSITLGTNKIIFDYPGPGHTEDNAIAYIHASDILLGGCLLKPVDGTKGNLNDADLTQWSHTIKYLQEQYPNVKLAVPGHGLRGDGAILDYTRQLFRDTAIHR